MDSAPQQDQNSVTLNSNGYIEIVVRGEQSYLSFDHLRGELEQLLEKLKSRGSPLLGLVDLTEMTGYSTGSNKAALELLETIPYTRVALFGGSNAIMTVTRLVIEAIGKGDCTQTFKNRAEALAWLLAEPD